MEDNKLTSSEASMTIYLLTKEKNRLQEVYDKNEEKGKFSLCAMYADGINNLEKIIKKLESNLDD